MSLYGIARARDTLARYREWALQEPDELNTAVLLLRLPPVHQVPEPPRGTRVLAVRVFALAAPENARRLVEPLLDEVAAWCMTRSTSVRRAQPTG